jgi:hypothetical protein
MLAVDVEYPDGLPRGVHRHTEHGTEPQRERPVAILPPPQSVLQILDHANLVRHERVAADALADPVLDDLELDGLLIRCRGEPQTLRPLEHDPRTLRPGQLDGLPGEPVQQLLQVVGTHHRVAERPQRGEQPIRQRRRRHQPPGRTTRAARWLVNATLADWQTTGRGNPQPNFLVT